MKNFNCIVCGEGRESNFYPYNKSRCKSCVIDYVTEWVRKDPRNEEKKRETDRRWRKNNPKRLSEIKDRYRRANLKKACCGELAWLRYPEAQTCEVEDCMELGERHHGDYNEPYKIRWLCRKHHKYLHRIKV